MLQISGTVNVSGNLTVEDLVIADGHTVQSETYSPGYSGWEIAGDGSAEFNDIRARGSLKASIFEINEYHALGGTFIVRAPSTAANDFTSVDSPATFDIDIHDTNAGLATFSVGDILVVKTFTAGSGVVANWYTVTAVGSQVGSVPESYRTYTVEKENGAEATFPKGTAIINYGPSGAGGIILSSDMDNAPFIDVFTHDGTPWVSTELRARMGNLNGQYGIAVDTWGFAAGDYADGNYVIIHPSLFEIKAADGGLTVDSNGLTLDNDISSTGRIKIQHGASIWAEILTTTQDFIIRTDDATAVRKILFEARSTGGTAFLDLLTPTGGTGTVTLGNNNSRFKINDTGFYAGPTLQTNQLFMAVSGNFRTIYGPGTSSNVAIHLGNDTDPQNYYNANTHTWRDRDTSPTQATLNATGFYPGAQTTQYITAVAGGITMPLQPMFSAYKLANTANVTGNNTAYTVIFDTESYDVGNNYNNTTGVFTAPVTGKYHFVATVLMADLGATATTGQMWFSVGGVNRIVQQLNIGAARDAGNLYEFSASVYVSLTATQTAAVQVRVNGVGADSVDVNGGVNFTYFEGRLVQ